MRAVFAISITCGFVCGLFVSSSFAQWEYGGKIIGYSYGDSDPLAVANVGDGATIVVWNSTRGSSYYDLYAQYVDSAGYAKWGDYGITIYEDEGTHQGYPAVLADCEGGAFIAWSDGRNYPDDWISLYGQRVDSLGNLLWDPNGRRLTTNPMNHTRPKLYDDGHGGFVTVYQSDNVGAQRVDGDGNILWDSAGVDLIVAQYYQLYPYTCRASDSTFITCWVDARNIKTLDTDIYMQKFDLAGNLYWNGTNGLPAVTWPHDQGDGTDGHGIVADGSGGAVVVWVDFRNYQGPVLYADRFSPDGQSLWQQYGIQLGDPEIYEAHRCQAFRIGDNFMFSWVAGGTGFEVSYVNRFGNFIWDDPVTLDTITTRNVVLNDSVGNFYFLTNYADSGGFTNRGVKVDTFGNRLWQPLPHVGYEMREKEIILDGYGGMIVFWKDLQSAEIKIARIYEDGHVGGDTTTSISSNEKNLLPDDIKLSQNYPNPFNARTTISYSLPEASDITVAVYNLLGQRVAVLFDGRQDAGRYSVSWDAADNPSGVYFARLQSGSRSENIKMILLK